MLILGKDDNPETNKLAKLLSKLLQSLNLIIFGLLPNRKDAVGKDYYGNIYGHYLNFKQSYQIKKKPNRKLINFKKLKELIFAIGIGVIQS
jgi:hypothetical protein